jgi:uncharacterized membrane protein
MTILQITHMPVKIAAGLMLFSGISHPAQLLIYGTGDPALVNASLMGTLFLFVGVALLSKRRWSLWLGVILPGLFGLGALFRILTESVTPFSYLHALIDAVVVIICLRELMGRKS